MHWYIFFFHTICIFFMIETRRFPCKLNASVISNWQTSLSKYDYPAAVTGGIALVVSVGASVSWVVSVMVVSVIVVASVAAVVALGRHV